MNNIRLTFFDIPKSIILSQVFGMIFFLYLDLHEFWFINMCIGGALATPIGLIICIVIDKSFIKTRMFYLTVATCIGFMLIFPFIIIHDKAINEFRSIKASSISKIMIYKDEFKQEPIVSINNHELISEFVEKSKDVKGYDSMSGRKCEEWYLVIYRNIKPIEISVQYLEDEQNKIQGFFVETNGNEYYIHGQYTSEGLKVWFDKVRNLYGY